jgi:hypothetical protein
MQQPSMNQPRAILSVPDTASSGTSESVEADTIREKGPLEI